MTTEESKQKARNAVAKLRAILDQTEAAIEEDTPDNFVKGVIKLNNESGNIALEIM